MNSLSALLHTIPLLSALSPAQLDRVAAICERCSFAADETVVKAGDQADAAFFIISGPVDCITSIGSETKSTAIPAGATVLELAMIVDLEVSATCIARGPARILKIPRNKMHDLMQEDIALTDTVIETLTRRLREMADTMREASAPFESNIKSEPEKKSA